MCGAACDGGVWCVEKRGIQKKTLPARGKDITASLAVPDESYMEESCLARTFVPRATNASAQSGVSSDGLMTAVHPAASAAPHGVENGEK